MSLLAQRTRLVVLVWAVSMASARAEPAPGNAEVIKLIASALDTAYGKTKKIEVAEAKLLRRWAFVSDADARRICMPAFMATLPSFIGSSTRTTRGRCETSGRCA